MRKWVITTKGWDLHVEWNNWTTSWMTMHILKESHLIDTAKFAVSKNIHCQPAFVWWDLSILQKRDRLILKLKTKWNVIKQTKFGVKIPMSIEESHEFDE